jgi:AGCS family alanine or glycine:cation symporter
MDLLGFAIVAAVVAWILLPGVQANSVADGIQNAFQLTPGFRIDLAVIFGAIVLV